MLGKYFATSEFFVCEYGDQSLLWLSSLITLHVFHWDRVSHSNPELSSLASEASQVALEASYLHLLNSGITGKLQFLPGIMWVWIEVFKPVQQASSPHQNFSFVDLKLTETYF